MGALERVLEKLRPLVRKNEWDYCVIWKLGDYSIRFIEMVGCCCGGAKDTQVYSKQGKLVQLCKDMVFPHTKTTKACDALAYLPTYIPISSGIRVEALISGRPRWINSDEITGTQLVIPFIGGLIEFFAAKQVPKDRNMIEIIMVECNSSLEKEGIIAFMGDNLKEQKLEGSIYSAPRAEEGNQFFQSTMSDYSWLEGSSTSSVCLVEPLPIDSSPGFRPEQVAGLDCSPGLTSPELLAESLMPTQSEYKHMIRPKKNFVKEKNLNDLRRREGESRKSRNLFTERNRRNKLKTKLLVLRSLVPDITKMDIQATLGDAKSYIEKLQNEVKALQNELKGMEEEANKNSELKDRTVAGKGKTEDYVTSHLSASDISTDQSKYNQDSLPAHGLAQQMEEKVEVSECGKYTFALKLIFEQRRGWFLMLMAAMQALGLNLTEANVISVKGRVMSIFKAEAKSDGVLAEQLKDSLLKLLQNGLLMDKA